MCQSSKVWVAVTPMGRLSPIVEIPHCRIYKLGGKKYQKELQPCNTIVVQLEGQIIAINLKIEVVAQARGHILLWQLMCAMFTLLGQLIHCRRVN